MTEKRIYQLAYDQLLELWTKEHDFLENHPENKISQVRESKLWNELEQLRFILLEKGY